VWPTNRQGGPDHEYGNRVGIFRILAVLDKYGVTPTLALDEALLTLRHADINDAPAFAPA
jgi:hypothetical protein